MTKIQKELALAYSAISTTPNYNPEYRGSDDDSADNIGRPTYDREADALIWPTTEEQILLDQKA